MVPRGRGLDPRPGLYSRDLCTPPKKMGQLRGIRSPPWRNTLENMILKRPCSQSGQIRPRTAGETITGWLDHATAGVGGGPSDCGRRVGLPRELEGAADGGLAFPTDGGVISRERRGR